MTLLHTTTANGRCSPVGGSGARGHLCHMRYLNSLA